VGPDSAFGNIARTVAGTSGGSIDGTIYGATNFIYSFAPVNPRGPLSIDVSKLGSIGPVGPVLICEFTVIFNSGKRTICQDFKDLRDLQELMVVKDHKDLKVFRELKDSRALRVSKVAQGPMDQTEPKEIKELRVSRGLEELKDFREHKGFKGLLDLQSIRVQRVHLAFLDYKVLLDQRVPPAHKEFLV